MKGPHMYSEIMLYSRVHKCSSKPKGLGDKDRGWMGWDELWDEQTKF